VTSGQEVRRLSTGSSRACLDFSPDGRRLVTGGGYYGEIQIWNVEDGTAVQQLSPSGPRSSSSYTQKVAYLPDPRGVVSGHYDGSIRLWRVPD
jgi:WD40 repeat protein